MRSMWVSSFCCRRLQSIRNTKQFSWQVNFGLFLLERIPISALGLPKAIFLTLVSLVCETFYYPESDWICQKL